MGDAGWSRAIDRGGPKAVYIEDNTFVGEVVNKEFVLDGRYGGRAVVRYNNMTCYIVETHTGCQNGGRAMLHHEIYENSYGDAGAITWIFCRIRDGTAVIFNNTITDGSSSQVIKVDNRRVCGPCAGYWATHLCDGTVPEDGNTEGYEGWPCLDQIGRGAKQAAEPIYAWNNILNGSPVGITEHANGCGRDVDLPMVEGRDYFNGVPKPGYVPYAYPHPLTGASDTQPPGPPKNLRVK